MINNDLWKKGTLGSLYIYLFIIYLFIIIIGGGDRETQARYNNLDNVFDGDNDTVQCDDCKLLIHK